MHRQRNGSKCSMLFLRPILILALTTLSLRADHVWVEGESGQTSNVQANSWYRSVRAQDLSGRDWLATYGSDTPAMAHFEVTVPATSDYILWVRANPIQAKLEVGVGESDAWLEVPITSEAHDTLNIAEDGKPDMRFLAWAKVGPISLTKGSTALQFRMSSKNGNHGGIDCFCLTTDEAWRPDKTLKPDDTRNWPALL